MLLGCVLPRGSSTRNGTQGPGWGAVPVSAAQRMPGRERGRHREGRGRGTQGGPSGVGTPAPGIQGSWIRAWHRARTTRPGRDDERYARSDAIREVNGRRPAQTGRRFFFCFAARAYFRRPHRCCRSTTALCQVRDSTRVLSPRCGLHPHRATACIQERGCGDCNFPFARQRTDPRRGCSRQYVPTTLIVPKRPAGRAPGTVSPRATRIATHKPIGISNFAY